MASSEAFFISRKLVKRSKQEGKEYVRRSKVNLFYLNCFLVLQHSKLGYLNILIQD